MERPAAELAPAAVLDVQQVDYRRDGLRILDGIDWRIGAGEHWALVGANGSGKTTLLQIVTGYAWPTSGAVTILGARYGECDLREHRKRIGWVSSALEHRIPRRDSARDIVLSGIDASLGVYRAFTPAEHEAAADALALMGMEYLGDRVFEVLSQGEQKRVLIARALVHRPALLILDEPCAGLDPVAREHFLDEIGALAAAPDGPALVFVTHHVEEIRPWITHVLALSAGRVAASGRRENVITTEVLSEVFDAPCAVSTFNNRYRLDLPEGE
ncbi:MAG: ABC transporter ATP-binding protein [Candidatus Hydrogenedentales bacterium]